MRRVAGQDMIWAGVSTPERELLMMRFLPLLDSAVMFGAGADNFGKMTFV
jgi:hypothetical protein